MGYVSTEKESSWLMHWLAWGQKEPGAAWSSRGAWVSGEAGRDWRENDVGETGRASFSLERMK